MCLIMVCSCVLPAESQVRPAALQRMFSPVGIDFKPQTHADAAGFQTRLSRPGKKKGPSRALVHHLAPCQPRRASENCAPESVVQFSCAGVASAQLTLDWVLRTSEVMLISTSVGLTFT